MSSTVDLVSDSTVDLSAQNTVAENPDGERVATKSFIKDMTMRERFSYVRLVITVEPILTLYIFPGGLCNIALFNLELEKGCRANLKFGDTICSAIVGGEVVNEKHNYTTESDAIQVIVSHMHSWQVPLQSVVPLLLILFVGSYSDRHKIRKPFIMLPLIGELFAITGCILSVVFMDSWSLEVLGLLQTVVPTFLGGPPIIIMASFAYISDVSTLEMRTLRVGILQIVLNICVVVAKSLSGVLFNAIGYIGMLLVAGLSYALAILYCFFCIKEPRKPDLGGDKKSFIVDAFDPRHALETLNLLLKKSPGNNRLFVALVLVILFVLSFVDAGDGGLSRLYLKEVFQITPLSLSYLETSATVIHLVGLIGGVWLFTKVLNFSDLVILILAFADKAAASVIFALARTFTTIYIAIVVGMLSELTLVGIRSMGTKIVKESDLGKVQSLFGIVGSLGATLAAPIYNSGIWVNSISSMPSLYLYIGPILYVLCIVVMIWLYFMMQKKANKVEAEEVEESKDRYQMTEHHTHVE